MHDLPRDERNNAKRAAAAGCRIIGRGEHAGRALDVLQSAMAFDRLQNIGAPPNIVSASCRLLARCMAEYVKADDELKYVDRNTLECEHGMAARGVLQAARNYMAARYVDNREAMQTASDAMMRLTRQLKAERAGTFCESGIFAEHD